MGLSLCYDKESREPTVDSQQNYNSSLHTSNRTSDWTVKTEQINNNVWTEQHENKHIDIKHFNKL